MSTETNSESTTGTASDQRNARTISLGVGDGATGSRTIGPDVFRILSLGCVLLLIASFVHVLHEVTQAVGGTPSLFALVGGMLLAGTLLARLIRPRTALLAALTVAGLGFAYYLESSGVGVGIVLSQTGALAADIATLATGHPLIRTVEAGLWTLGFAPAPVFLSWYLALRGRYALSVLPGGFALAFLVLTGDADLTVTLLGTLAGLGAVGFGELERRGGSISQADLLAALFALIIVLSLSVSFVPGGDTGPASIGATDAGTLEGTIDSAGERSGFTGQVDLSPEVRFTVESEQPSYWRTGVYDRFTGDEWVRTGQEQPLDGPINEPSGDYETMQQLVTAETEIGVMPVAPQPLTVTDGAAQYAELSAHGQVHPSTTLIEGDSYVVESAVVDPGQDELKRAGTEYPDQIEERYLQQPEDTSDEFAEYTANVTADAETPYEKAAAIETHLRSSKSYSLDVSQPSGNVAEEFLFEMDEGYCIYFATTMTQMLRAEEVPTRYVTGYTSGQQVDDDTHVVRGLDAHAWVEVYFPDHGWVAFEPTPSGERDDVHADQLEDARADDVENVDIEESEDVPVREDDDDEDEQNDRDPTGPDEGEQDDPETNETDPDQGPDTDPDSDTENESNETTDGTSLPDADGDGSSEGDDSDGFSLPVTVSRELLALTTVVLVGLAAGIHRTDGRTRLQRLVGLLWQRPTDDPDDDAARAYRRLERLLGRTHRPRRPGESARSYVTALRTAATDDTGDSLESATDVDPTDPRIEAVLESYEQAVYGGGVNRREATSAVEAVDELVREQVPLVGGAMSGAGQHKASTERGSDDENDGSDESTTAE
ncbi:DUF3488 and transglutaminase-like domain-containing protein [Natrialba sp. SSL1]|uniref:DUF3488 and transglutaminase-like domain-containing protein n=1 Tax=Natrialba sp. SSL1 TaxID=1869245 RepID=UPI0008F954A7|nr:transglutaminase domain-containing protein [Natrialba sp. SSL1]OIB58134.1 transglutaminase [Natrialba sp. SSL1]